LISGGCSLKTSDDIDADIMLNEKAKGAFTTADICRVAQQTRSIYLAAFFSQHASKTTKPCREGETYAAPLCCGATHREKNATSDGVSNKSPSSRTQKIAATSLSKNGANDGYVVTRKTFALKG
jgi:hypothetical protein